MRRDFPPEASRCSLTAHDAPEEHSLPCAHGPAVREPSLAPLGWARRRQLLRDGARPGVSRDPFIGRTARRLPALQVRRARARRDAPARSRRHAQRRRRECGPSALHAMVRRCGQGDRRRDHRAPGRAVVPHDSGRSQLAVARAQRRRATGDRRRRVRLARGALPAGPERARDPQGTHRRGRRRTQVLPQHVRHRPRDADQHLAHRVHRRPRL
jgi:hypothetical protein